MVSIGRKAFSLVLFFEKLEMSKWFCCLFITTRFHLDATYLTLDILNLDDLFTMML